MLSASKAVFRCPCIALLDMAGWLSHPLGTNPRSHFFFACLREQAHDAQLHKFFLLARSNVLCCCRCPSGKRILTLDPFPPCHPLQCTNTHAML